MKRILLATCAAAALSLYSAPSQAQWTVLCANCEPELNAAGRWIQQAADMASQIEDGRSRLQELQRTYGALTRVTDLGSAVSALSHMGLRNPLPVNPYAIQGVLSGRTGAGGMLGSLSGLYSGTHTQNTVFTRTGGSWLDEQITASGGGIAGAQAIALQLYQSAGERLELLPELQARIATENDPSGREALIARLAAEQAYIQSTQVQAQALGNYMAAEFQLREQRREEKLSQSFTQVLDDAVARGWIEPAQATATAQAGW